MKTAMATFKYSMFLILLMSFNGALNAGEFSLSHVLSQGYWYSRHNVGHLVMRSGNGNRFHPQKSIVDKMVEMSSDQLSSAIPPKSPALLRRVYNIGVPHYYRAHDGNNTNFLNYRWTTPIDPLTTYEAFGWTLMKEIEWSKQFNVDAHFGSPNEIMIKGAQQRFQGLVLCAEAIMQINEFFQNPQRFTSNKLADDYVAIEALSNFAHYISNKSSDIMKENRCSLIVAMMKKKTVEEVSSDILKKIAPIYKRALPPKTFRERSLAIQAFTWYALASPAKRGELKIKILAMGEELRKLNPTSSVNLSYSIRGLIEVYRVTKQLKFLKRVGSLFKKLSSNFNRELGLFVDQSVYRSEDVASFLGSLNATRLFAGIEVDQKDLEFIFVNFFNTVINKAKMQISAPPVSLILDFERKTDPLFHRHPDLPEPKNAGGVFGIAPVFSSQIKYENGVFSNVDDRFNTAGSMHLANEMMWFHNEEVNGFPCPDSNCVKAQDESEPGDKAPSFTSIYNESLISCSSCHSGVRSPFGLDLSTRDIAYSNLVNRTAGQGGPFGNIKLVLPNFSSPSKSYLVSKIIEKREFRIGRRMPIGGPYLSEEQIENIKKWIDAGARND